MRIDVSHAETILRRSIRPKQTARTSWTIQTHSDELNRARRRTFHEVNSQVWFLSETLDVRPRPKSTLIARVVQFTVITSLSLNLLRDLSEVSRGERGGNFDLNLGSEMR